MNTRAIAFLLGLPLAAVAQELPASESTEGSSLLIVAIGIGLLLVIAAILMVVMALRSRSAIRSELEVPRLNLHSPAEPAGYEPSEPHPLHTHAASAPLPYVGEGSSEEAARLQAEAVPLYEALLAARARGDRQAVAGLLAPGLGEEAADMLGQQDRAKVLAMRARVLACAGKDGKWEARVQFIGLLELDDGEPEPVEEVWQLVKVDGADCRWLIRAIDQVG